MRAGRRDPAGSQRTKPFTEKWVATQAEGSQSTLKFADCCSRELGLNGCNVEMLESILKLQAWKELGGSHRLELDCKSWTEA